MEVICLQPMISILTMLNWNPNILDKLHIPDSLTDQKEAIQINLVEECGELPLVVTNPKQFEILLDKWSSIQNVKWTRMQKAMELSYNPIENYDRMEEVNSKRTPDLTNTYTDKNSSANTVQNFKNGYNSTSQVLSDKSVSGTDIETTNKSTGNETYHSVGHIHGNIGVTTSQQMLQSELDVAKNLIADVIVDDFKNKFCIVCY